MMNKKFWRATAIRALYTFIEVILGGWTAGTLITMVDWKYLLLAAASATVYSIIKSIFVGLPEVDNG